MPYFAVHELKRYKVKLAASREELKPTSYDFSIAPDDFNFYEDCLAFCNSLNIHLRGNIPIDDEDEEC
jgi:hypothetical protein